MGSKQQLPHNHLGHALTQVKWELSSTKDEYNQLNFRAGEGEIIQRQTTKRYGNARNNFHRKGILKKELRGDKGEKMKNLDLKKKFQEKTNYQQTKLF